MVAQTFCYLEVLLYTLDNYTIYNKQTHVPCVGNGVSSSTSMIFGSGSRTGGFSAEALGCISAYRSKGYTSGTCIYIYIIIGNEWVNEVYVTLYLNIDTIDSNVQ